MLVKEEYQPQTCQFVPSTLQECWSLFEAYRASMPGINDSFWEDHVRESAVHRIELAGAAIGLFGVHGGENLCFFHVTDPYLRHAQPIFRALLEQFAPRYAYVPTRDELFLSLCMDCFVSIERQAYFFAEGGAPVRPPEYARTMMQLATLEDAGDILDDPGAEEAIRQGKYYVLRQAGEFLGQGYFSLNQLTPNSVSIGMSVHPDHRQKGVGRSIIMHLAAISHEQALTPVCGCWYYNHNSKRTLESAGFVTRTRLLKIWFVADDTQSQDANT